MSAWIPVTERLPPQSVDVLFVDGGRLCLGRMFQNADIQNWWNYLEFDDDAPIRPVNVTHWMPLPALPIASGKPR